MLRVMAQVLPREVLLVVASDLLLGTVAMCLALWISGGPAALPVNVTPSQLNLVLSLTVSFAVAAGVLGLYRSEAVGAFHSLWIKALLATILGLLLTTLLPATFRRNFGNLPGGGVAVLAVWLGCLMATRFAFTVV